MPFTDDDDFLNKNNPDSTVHVVASMAAIAGKSSQWIVKQWKAGILHAHERGIDPFSNEGRRGRKILLSTHPDTITAAVRIVEAKTATRLEPRRATFASEHRITWTTCSGGSPLVK